MNSLLRIVYGANQLGCYYSSHDQAWSVISENVEKWFYPCYILQVETTGFVNDLDMGKKIEVTNEY